MRRVCQPQENGKACADQLAGILTKLFSLSLTNATIPTCLRASTVIPIPKKPGTESFSDYRPKALTPVFIKSFVRIVSGTSHHTSTSQHIPVCLQSKSVHGSCHYNLPSQIFDPFGKQKSYVDYSSAFNGIIPDILSTKLLN